MCEQCEWGHTDPQIERSITMSDRATVWFFAMFVPAILAMAPPLLVWASIAAGVCLLVAVGHMVASYRVGAKHE